MLLLSGAGNPCAVCNKPVILAQYLHRFGIRSADRSREPVRLGEQRRPPGHRNLAIRFRANRFRQLQLADILVFGDDVTHREEFIRRLATFAQERIIVIARNRRLILILQLAVRPVPEPEIRSAVEHVEINRCLLLQHLFEYFGYIGGVPRMMRLSPMIEPPVPILHAHQRLIRLILAQLGEGFFRTGPKIHSSPGPRHRTALQHMVCWPVRGEQQDIHSALDHSLADMLQIPEVIAEAAVFVLDLQRNDRSAIGAQQRL
ncbi:hypothetical protein D3C81_252460 [compost metagenome]